MLCFQPKVFLQAFCGKKYVAVVKILMPGNLRMGFILSINGIHESCQECNIPPWKKIPPDFPNSPLYIEKKEIRIPPGTVRESGVSSVVTMLPSPCSQAQMKTHGHRIWQRIQRASGQARTRGWMLGWNLNQTWWRRSLVPGWAFEFYTR